MSWHNLIFTLLTFPLQPERACRTSTGSSCPTPPPTATTGPGRRGAARPTRRRSTTRSASSSASGTTDKLQEDTRMTSGCSTITTGAFRPRHYGHSLQETFVDIQVVSILVADTLVICFDFIVVDKYFKISYNSFLDALLCRQKLLASHKCNQLTIGQRSGLRDEWCSYKIIVIVTIHKCFQFTILLPEVQH